MSLLSRAFFVLVLALGSAAPATAATLLVDSVGDLGDQVPGDGACTTGGFVATGGTPIFVLECTLRATIQEANALAGADTLQFAPYISLDGAGFARITPGSGLPAITEALLIDGYTAPGYDTGDPDQEPVVQLDGGSAGLPASGSRSDSSILCRPGV